MRITPDRVIPALQWGRQYDRGKLVSDLLAAVIATVMLIPQSLAYAMLAGLPPEVGLYASILPPVGYALFGSSRLLAVGPVAVVSLLTFEHLTGEVFLSQHAAIEKLDPAATRLADASLLSGGADGVRRNGMAAGAASRAAEQAIQPVIIELNSKPAADTARTSAKDNGVGDDDGPFTNHGSDI
jgi:hypothetical protein